MSHTREPSKSRQGLEAGLGRHTRLASQSRAGSRSVSVASRPFPQDLAAEAEVFIHPDGPVAAELVNSKQHDFEEGTLGAVEEPEETEQTLEQRWWKRPSPWWFLCIMPFVSMARAATTAPRVEIYIRLACDEFKPETRTDLLSSSDRWRLCSSDPVIQAEVAKLALAMTVSMGVLGCLTTAWWGSLSDRSGRTRVLTYAIMGLCFEDACFLLVCNFSKVLPGGYWFLLGGPIVAGLLGGMNTVSVGIHAYIADCTEPTSRSRFFSLFLGLLFVGFSIGPTLGSILISYTDQPVSVFYIAALLHLAYALIVCFIIPESLSAAQMAEFGRIHTAETRSLQQARSKGGPVAWLGRMLGFLRPLALLLPSARLDANAGRKRKTRNWSLLLLVAGYGLTISLKGDITYEYQYMSLMFGWSSEQLGYYTSALGATRALFLTILLPLVTKLLQPKAPAVQLPAEPDEVLEPSASNPAAPPSPPPVLPTLDLAIARLSTVIEIAAYVLMAMAPNGYFFTAFAIVSALGVGFSPAINSVASALYTQGGGKELGKLFGALGVVQTICSQVLGPFLFGVTYMKTVATAPKAIFVVSISALVLSFALLAPIRLQRARGGDGDGDSDVEEQPVEDNERVPLLGGDDDRGRRTAKPPSSPP